MNSVVTQFHSPFQAVLAHDTSCFTAKRASGRRSGLELGMGSDGCCWGIERDLTSKNHFVGCLMGFVLGTYSSYFSGNWAVIFRCDWGEFEAVAERWSVSCSTLARLCVVGLTEGHIRISKFMCWKPPKMSSVKGANSEMQIQIETVAAWCHGVRMFTTMWCSAP